MTAAQFSPSSWARCSHALIERIMRPRNVGFFAQHQEGLSGMRLAIGRAGDRIMGEVVAVFLVVDETDGAVADAKFQAFGRGFLLGAADAACDIVLRKHYEQVRRITVEFIDRALRDFSSIPAFPEEAESDLRLVHKALGAAVSQCEGLLPFDPLVASPVPSVGAAEEGEKLDWAVLTKEEKLSAICSAIATEIQPYIALDAGGIEVLDLQKDREVLIAYQGACTSCPSATGATLQSIEHILRAKVHAELIVKPDPSFLSL